MRILFNLALPALLLASVHSLAVSGDFCQHEKTWRAHVCIYINNCIRNTNGLLNELKRVADLKDVAAAHIFNLRHVENLTTAADLYNELTAYTNIFRSFNTSMGAFKQPEAINEVAKKTNAYLTKLANNIIELEQTTEELSDKVDTNSYQASETMASVGAGCLKEQQTIYICSYYVTERLNILLKQWKNSCVACQRKRKASAKNTSTGKKNKGGEKGQKKGKNGSEKGKKKGKNGGKGKGKGKQNKNRSNKRNKSQETKTQ